jgi:hypothetical protein
MTQGIARFDGYGVPGRGAVDRITTAADKISANTRAITEIRELCDSIRDNATIPSRRIRQILKKHGIAQ